MPNHMKMIPMKKGAFKPCPGCPTPAKCKAAGVCLAKKKR